MANYSEAQKKAVNKYRAGKACLNLVITPEQKERYQEYAKKQGISLTQLICMALDSYIDSKQ